MHHIVDGSEMPLSGAASREQASVCQNPLPVAEVRSFRKPANQQRNKLWSINAVSNIMFDLVATVCKADYGNETKFISSEEGANVAQLRSCQIATHVPMQNLNFP